MPGPSLVGLSTAAVKLQEVAKALTTMYEGRRILVDSTRCPLIEEPKLRRAIEFADIEFGKTLNVKFTIMKYFTMRVRACNSISVPNIAVTATCADQGNHCNAVDNAVFEQHLQANQHRFDEASKLLAASRPSVRWCAPCGPRSNQGHSQC